MPKHTTRERRGPHLIRREIAPRKCRNCGRTFTPDHLNQVCCCDNCRSLYWED